MCKKRLVTSKLLDTLYLSPSAVQMDEPPPPPPPRDDKSTLLLADIVNLLFCVLNDSVWLPPVNQYHFETEEEKHCPNPVVDDSVTCEEPLNTQYHQDFLILNH